MNISHVESKFPNILRNVLEFVGVKSKKTSLEYDNNKGDIQ